ncbi:hypothetical protein D187_007227 [Cystobacter fuscus DSM 2262]|uniref:Uncharacterized protein n=1 Tax=Cystobacter fuscus (strain ATCC 25194 / DSM 2262 / NBRC 100088 / M29) TaxID=1242864 RepID=S9QJY8_CYSF2|nr:hypothetical protein D187_007227 [Cystobacter fuscus DSM 2262]
MRQDFSARPHHGETVYRRGEHTITTAARVNELHQGGLQGRRHAGSPRTSRSAREPSFQPTVPRPPGTTHHFWRIRQEIRGFEHEGPSGLSHDCTHPTRLGVAQAEGDANEPNRKSGTRHRCQPRSRTQHGHQPGQARHRCDCDLSLESR